jgi:hypothetical protein
MYKEELLELLMELPMEKLLIVKKEIEVLSRRNALKVVSSDTPIRFKRSKRKPDKTTVPRPQLLAGGLPGNPRLRKRKDPSHLKGEFTL